MAAELLLDGRNVERQRILRTLLDAVKVLVTEINERNLLVKGNEKELHGTFENLDFLGFSDIYLEDASGNKFVIDMKWSTSSYYEKHLKEDKALQLATYSWLLDPEGLRVKCAYFLFPMKQLTHLFLSCHKYCSAFFHICRRSAKEAETGQVLPQRIKPLKASS